MVKYKKRVFTIIQIGSKEDFISYSFDIFIVIAIGLNLFVTLFSTFEQSVPYEGPLHIVETVTSVIFLIEYILRIWTAECLYPGDSRFKAPFHFIFSLLGLIDLFTFLPFFLPVFFPAGAVAFRVLRVIRIFRLFRINSQYDAFNAIFDVFREKKNQLLSSVGLILIFMIAASLCVYSVEHDVQPDKFDNAFSGLWWATSTLMTVGYGDVYPITTLGKALSIVITFLGVGLVAIPTGIISAGFVEQYDKFRVGGVVDDTKINFVTPILDENHPWIEKHLRDIVLPPDMELISVFREGNALDMKPTTKLKIGDELVIYLKHVKAK
ncbi:MAG: ion transporter [Lachnospiraceae bacterium]|nr:ion transporter [Lachnospiraceae bacterium]